MKIYYDYSDTKTVAGLSIHNKLTSILFPAHYALINVQEDYVRLARDRCQPKTTALDHSGTKLIGLHPAQVPEMPCVIHPFIIFRRAIQHQACQAPVIKS